MSNDFRGARRVIMQLELGLNVRRKIKCI